MTNAEDVFKKAWNARNDEWLSTFERGGDYTYPTEPSERVQTGLLAVANYIIAQALDRTEIDDRATGSAYAAGIIFATTILTGDE